MKYDKQSDKQDKNATLLRKKLSDISVDAKIDEGRELTDEEIKLIAGGATKCESFAAAWRPR